MHGLNSAQSIVEDIFQQVSKFLSKMMENGVLKTYTFMYTENYGCIEKNYNSVVNTIEDFKDLLMKICSEISFSNKRICNTDTYTVSSSLDACLPRNSDSSYTNLRSTFSTHNTGYDLYSRSSMHSTIDQNIQFITNNSSAMCSNLSQNLPNNENSLCGTLTQNLAGDANGMCASLDFASAELSNEDLKQNVENIDFNECTNMTGHVSHTLSYSSFKSGITQTQGDMMPRYDVENVNYSKSTSSEIDLDGNIGLNNMPANCNESLYNTLKEAISGDFLQNMKFQAMDTHATPIERTMTFNEQVPYNQCAPTLQLIDLDILSNSNERINNALDRIFEDQFVENDPLLESECWNVDMNLPSTEPMQSNLDLQTADFELPSCAENLKEKTIRTELSNSLVSHFNSSSEDNLERLTSDLANSLSAMNTSMPNTLSHSMSSSLHELEGKKYFCEHCGVICNTKLKLKIHLRRQHNVYINSLHKCDECGKFFRRRIILKRHMNVHKDIQPFKCQYCLKNFSQKITLDSHIQLHNAGMYKFPCSVCQKRFPTQAKLNFHFKSHEEPQLRCEICAKMFTTKQYLNLHKKSHNKPARIKKYSCTECSSQFEKSIELSIHVTEVHPDITFSCFYEGCNRSFVTNRKLRDHIYKRHSSTKPIEKVESEKFECELCHIIFVKRGSYHRHYLLMHCEKVDVENSFNCVHCDKRFTTETGLDDHLEKFHSVSHSKDMDYSCSVCGSLFYKEKSLKEHMNIHSDFGTHLCPTCGTVFTQKSDFLAHQNIHLLKKQNGLKKHKCETCSMRYDSKMELKQHELDIHNLVPDLEELKPFACPYCDKRFTTRGKCNLHIETHSDSRKYQCNTCRKTFFRRDIMKEHMMTHTGHRAYVCKTCGSSFTQKSALKGHEATHERKDTFTCDKCNKIFQSKQALNYHLKTHEGNFRFACEICGKKFVRKCHYDIHVSSHSNERPFKCSKCSITYKTSKHLREHIKKAHQNETNFNSLLDTMYSDCEIVSESQPSLLNDYIPSIHPLDAELMFSKT